MRFLSLILLFLWVSCTFAVTNSSLDKSLIKLVNAKRIQYQLPALSISILLPAETMTRNYVSGYLTQHKKQKITADTLFQMGSITKTFTATLILKLVEEHKLSLNDKLSKWFPEYPKWGNITIRELLTHTSGAYKVVDTKSFWQNLKSHPKKHWTLTELVNLAYPYPDYFKPGQGYNYANTDYILLGMIIEKVTRKPIVEIFKTYLTQLGLKNTYYTALGYPKSIIKNLAHGYDDEGTFGYNVDVTNVSTSFASSAGAIVSTPNNIILLLKQLFSGKILNKETLQKMQTLFSDKNGQPVSVKRTFAANLPLKKPWFELGQAMGMGLVYFKSYGFVWMHAGGMPGYQSAYAYNPCKGIYVALVYSKQPKKSFVFVNIAEAIFKVLDQSALVKNQVEHYQKIHALPWYCKEIDTYS